MNVRLGSGTTQVHGDFTKFEITQSEGQALIGFMRKGDGEAKTFYPLSITDTDGTDLVQQTLASGNKKDLEKLGKKVMDLVNKMGLAGQEDLSNTSIEKNVSGDRTSFTASRISKNGQRDHLKTIDEGAKKTFSAVANFFSQTQEISTKLKTPKKTFKERAAASIHGVGDAFAAIRRRQVEKAADTKTEEKKPQVQKQQTKKSSKKPTETTSAKDSPKSSSKTSLRQESVPQSLEKGERTSFTPKLATTEEGDEEEGNESSLQETSIRESTSSGDSSSIESSRASSSEETQKSKETKRKIFPLKRQKAQKKIEGVASQQLANRSESSPQALTGRSIKPAPPLQRSNASRDLRSEINPSDEKSHRSTREKVANFFTGVIDLIHFFVEPRSYGNSVADSL